MSRFSTQGRLIYAASSWPIRSSFHYNLKMISWNTCLEIWTQLVLPEVEENGIEETLMFCAEWGFPLLSTDIQIKVQQYLNFLDKNEPRFKENMPGIDWFKSFMKRQPCMTIKLAQKIQKEPELHWTMIRSKIFTWILNPILKMSLLQHN